MNERTKGLERRGLARGLRIFLDVFIFLILAAAVIRAVGASISAFTDYRDGWVFEVPVAIGEGSFYTRLPVEGSQDTGSGFLSRISQGRGNLILYHHSLPLHLGGEAVILLLYGVLLWGIFMLRQILVTTAAGRPFDPLNPTRLNRLGWIILSLSVLASVAQYLASKWVLSRFGPVSIPLAPAIEVHGEWLMCGLLVLVLAAIWSHAVLMAEDQSLTV